MKRYLLFFAMLLAGITSVYAAQGSVSVTKIRNFKPGYTGYFEIHISGSDNLYQAFQCDITLPDGLTYLDFEKGNLCNGHTILTSAQPSGKRRFTVAANPVANFNDMNGEVFTVYFTVSSTASGTLTGGLLSGVYGSIGSTNYTFDDVTFSIEVGNTITLDEDEKRTPANVEGVNVEVFHHFSAGKWSTLCLPFGMTAEQITNAFGSNVKIGEFNNYDFDEDQNTAKITVNFKQVDDALQANKPYIVKVADDVESFSVTDATVNIAYSDNPYINFGSKLNAKNARAMIGVYKLTELDEDYLYIKDNTYKYSTGKSKLKPYHAYFWLNDFESPDVSLSRQFEIKFEDETMGIINNRRTVSDGHYYDLMGNAVETPHKGIYLKDGKKVVVK